MIFFQTNSPANFASFVYDAIVMLGVGICQAQVEASKQLSKLDNNTSSHPVSIDRETLIRHMHNMTLQGASGPISPFPEDESYRNPNDLHIGLYNVRHAVDEAGSRVYKPVLRSIWTKGLWQNVPGVSLLYRDGTMNPPNGLRYVENNYLSPQVRAWVYPSLLLRGWSHWQQSWR